MSRILIQLCDLTSEKQMEIIEEVEKETGEMFSSVEVSHEVFIHVNISEDGIEF